MMMMMVVVVVVVMMAFGCEVIDSLLDSTGHF
jgi:hypothetical protein